LENDKESVLSIFVFKNGVQVSNLFIYTPRLLEIPLTSKLAPHAKCFINRHRILAGKWRLGTSPHLLAAVVCILQSFLPSELAGKYGGYYFIINTSSYKH